MKKIIIIIAMIFAIIELKSQDSQPDGLFFQMYNYSSTFTKQIDIADFQQNHFILGWQWDNHPKITEALKMNTNQSDRATWDPYPNNSSISIDYIWQMHSWYDYDYYGTPHLVSHCFIYKPTLNFDANMNVINSTDPDHNIFGFRINNNPKVINQNRLELNSGTNYTNPVLQKPWTNDRYCLIDQNDVHPSNSGQHFIITVNLKRKDFTNNEKDPTKPILKITLPYILLGQTISTNSITFTGLPDVNNLSSMSYTYKTPNNNVHTNNRGYCYGITAGNTNTFTIYENMLPNQDDFNSGIGPDITISASFTCSGRYPITNPNFKGLDTNQVINFLDMNVYYEGNCSVLLNYIRVGDVESDSLFKGYYDIEYQTLIQDGITLLNKKKYNLFRFYLKDEIGLNQFFVPQYEFWTTSRYFNRLVGGLVTTENTPVDPRFAYHVGLTDGIWTGFGGNYSSSAAAPYWAGFPHFDKSMYGELYKMMGLGLEGYRGPKYVLHNNTLIPNTNLDTTNSNYETKLWNRREGWNTLLRSKANDTSNAISYYQYSSSILNSSASIQASIDIDAYNYLFTKGYFLYTNKPWWTYFLPNSRAHVHKIDTKKLWSDTSNIYPSIDETNPMTGEMMRYCQWRAIILGCKGFMYDATNRPYETKTKQVAKGDTDESVNPWTGLGFAGANADPQYLNFVNSHSLTDLVYTDSTEIGGDFEPLQGQYDYNNFNEWIRWNESCTFLGIQPERLYIGRKSPRTMMLQTHSWIDENKYFLMRLRLISWAGKGFRLWTNADTAKFPSNIMRNFLKVDTIAYYIDPAFQYINDPYTQFLHTIPGSIKIRPIGRTKRDSLSGLIVPYYEPFDSCFFDVSILRDSSDNNLTGILYYGIVNRRTDPLVHDTIIFNNNKDTNTAMKFYSSAEIEKFVQFGGNTCVKSDTGYIWKPASYWQGLFWTALGAREITLPFNYNKNLYSNLNYLHIEELELDNDNLNNPSLNPLRQAKYYHKIDTNIALDGYLIMRLGAGDGKILKAKLKSYNNSACNICDLLNDTNSINIEIDTNSALNKYRGDSCCFDVYINNKTSCSFSNIPITIITNSERVALVYYDDPPGLRSGKYKSDSIICIIESNLPPNTRQRVITMCANPDKPYINYTIKIGDSLSYCNKKINGFLECGNRLLIDCCDSINVDFVGLSYSDIKNDTSCTKDLQCRISDMNILNQCSIVNYEIKTTHLPHTANGQIISPISSLGIFSDSINHVTKTRNNSTTITFKDSENHTICEKVLLDTCVIRNCCDEINAFFVGSEVGDTTETLSCHRKLVYCINDAEVVSECGFKKYEISSTLNPHTIKGGISKLCDSIPFYDLTNKNGDDISDTTIIKFEDSTGAVLCEKTIIDHCNIKTCCEAINAYFEGLNYGDTTQTTSCTKKLSYSISDTNILNHCQITKYNVTTTYLPNTASGVIKVPSDSIGIFYNPTNKNGSTIHDTTTIRFLDANNNIICEKVIIDSCDIMTCCDGIDIKLIPKPSATISQYLSTNGRIIETSNQEATQWDNINESLYLTYYWKIAIRQSDSSKCPIDSFDITSTINTGQTSHQSLVKNLSYPYNFSSTTIVDTVFFQYCVGKYGGNFNDIDTITIKFYDHNGKIICTKQLYDTCHYHNSIMDKIVERNNDSTKFSAKVTNKQLTTLSVVPNPATDELNIKTFLDTKQYIKLELYNSLGNKVIDIYDGLAKGLTTKSINTSNLINGLYFVKLTTDTDIKTISVIVQH